MSALRLSLLLVAALPFCGLSAQTPADTAGWRRAAVQLFRHGDSLAARPDTPSRRAAVEPLRQAAALFSKAGARANVGTALTELGVVFEWIGQVDSALVYDRQALHFARDSASVARIALRVGLAMRGTGQPDSALAYDRAALRIFRARGDRTQEATATLNIGAVYAGVGQMDSALAYFRQVLPIEHALGNHAAEATALSNIGVVLNRVGEADSALSYHRQALAIARSIADSSREATEFVNISVAFDDLRQFDSALVYAREGLALHHAAGELRGEAAALAAIAQVFIAKDQADSVLVYFRRGLAIDRLAGNRSDEATLLNNIGEVFIALKELDSAQVYQRLALPLQRAVGDRTGGAATMGSMGATFRRAGKLDSAAFYYGSATGLLAGISDHAGGEYNQLSFNEKSADIFGGWMLTWLAIMRRDSARAADWTKVALAVAERGRAQVLRQLMGTTHEIPLNTNLIVEGDQLARRITQSAAAALVYAMADDSLVTWLILPRGAVITNVQPMPSAPFDTLIAAMRFGVAGVDTKSNRGRGDPLDPTTLPPAVVARALADSGRAVRQELTDIVLPPNIRRNLPATGEIVVIPQGGLALVPFGLLPLDSAGTTLLGDRLAIRYGPSLAAVIDAEDRAGLDTTRGADRARQLSPTLIVGDPTMPAPFRLAGKSYALGDLPGAKDEGRAVADSLGAPQWLTGDQATEGAVQARLPAARIVHLATHGLVFSSDAHARLSFVALAPDAQHDGHLSVGVIIDSLTLHAELVVLSACQTAVGDVKSAEGTLGLQRAMLAKGARSVLVSLWNVSDVATLFLVQRFYHHWLHDAGAPSKSESLRLAQADVRAEARNPAHPEHHDWADPFYWAAFQLVGAP